MTLAERIAAARREVEAAMERERELAALWHAARLARADAIAALATVEREAGELR